MTFYTRPELERLGVLAPPRPQHLTPRTTTTPPLIGYTRHWEGAIDTNPFGHLHQIQATYFAKGYGDIPYASANDNRGNIYCLRDQFAWIGAHAESADNEANTITLGHCFLEDTGTGTITADGYAALNFTRGLFHLRFGHQPAEWAHSYWARTVGKATTCPGPVQHVWVAHLGGKT